MRCPYCKNDTKVVDKRDKENITRRRRECLKCKKRFTTYERIETKELIIIKKDKRTEPFDREKLKTGLTKAFEKRPISQEEINKIVDDIENKIREKNKKEISSKEIGEMVIKILKRKDKIAYIRFASVYKDFKNVGQFREVIKEI